MFKKVNYLKCQYILLILTLISCSKKIEPDNRIALKTDKVEVSFYEYEKHLDYAFQNKNNINKRKLNEFKNNFINRQLMLSDAYNKGYDTLASIVNQVDVMADFMMVQKYGYLWKKIETPKILEYTKLTKDKLNKRGKLYQFEIIQCSDSKELSKLLGNDTIIDNHQEFNEVKNKSYLNTLVTFSTNKYQWPFNQFSELRDILIKMKVGEISDLMKTNNNYFFFRLDNIEDIKLSNSNKNALISELTDIAEKEIDTEKDIEMMAHGNPTLNHESIKKIAKYINAGNQAESYPDKDTVISYKLNNIEKHITFHKYLYTIRYQPTSIDLGTPETLEKSILQYFYNDYLSWQAEEMGLYEQPKFILDKRNYKNNVIYGYYITDEIINQIKVDSSEIEEFYEHNIERYKKPETLLTNCFIFKTEKDALNALPQISSYYLSHPVQDSIDTDHFANLSEVIYDHALLNTEHNKIGIADLQQIESLKEGESSFCINYKDGYAIFIKRGEQDNVYLELRAVYENIETEIRNNKIYLATLERGNTLRNKYTIEINNLNIKDF